MLSLGVVVSVNVGKDLDLSMPLVNELAALEHLGLEGTHEGFGPGIVIRIGSSRHALSDSGLLEKGSECLASVLAATVAVKKQFPVTIRITT